MNSCTVEASCTEFPTANHVWPIGAPRHGRIAATNAGRCRHASGRRTAYNPSMTQAASQSLTEFSGCTQDWFLTQFGQPTPVQAAAWPILARNDSALLLAPTGSGKTLAAFLAALDRLMFQPAPVESAVRVLYISPLKALGVDIDRNLRAPINGLMATAAQSGVACREPTVGIRSGDTPTEQRRRMLREPPDVLITTPESLYLILTSQASETLRHVETVIVDEIHALAGTKRGAHLFLSLERLEQLRRRHQPESPPLQRVGLSATQRPLDEIARLLGGADASPDETQPPETRPVAIVDASAPKQFELRVETPADEVDTNPPLPDSAVDGGTDAGTDAVPAARPAAASSVWPAIQPRLVELIRSNRSTIIFVNSRRLAERLASAINQTAGEELAQAHHGSLARDARAEIEDRLKRGVLPAMVATSSMELGIDMGAVDLVIQIEAPPSIASGTQRIGRAGHQVGAPSSGVIFPKYRGDLLACAAATGAMQQGWVEETRYPRNPLDVLAQHLVAMTCREPLSVDEAFATVRSAAPFFELPRTAFEGVLDMLSGRYPSDEFAELKPRLTWDRSTNTIHPRRGGQRLAILNAGTIPDRGLYGVFLAGDGPDGIGGSRVGELDEEMVFETRPGDVFLLGASSWRVLEITRDRVLVAPAPGEPGRMPFWHGDRPGRPLEFGRTIGRLARDLATAPAAASRTRLTTEHGLTDAAADGLLDYLRRQVEAAGVVPTDDTIVVESFPDEIGDWRVVVLTPFGARVHAPWALLIGSRLREQTGAEVDLMWTDDGMVFRLPEAHAAPPPDWFFPRPEDVERQLIQEIGNTALFAGRFRENAARSLLLPRRFPGRRTPLWLQRRRAGDLLNVAARFRNFPVLLETYRECLRDAFDVDGLTAILRDVRNQTLSVREVRSEFPSPFAAAVMFSYAGNFLYNADAPLAERKAQTLALDHAQLRELLGSVDLREVLDPGEVERLQSELQRLADFRIGCLDDVHDTLLSLGPLTQSQLLARCQEATRPQLVAWLDQLSGSGRIVQVKLSGQPQLAAAEDIGRLRDAIGLTPPAGVPAAFLEPVADAVEDLVSRFARTHTPFCVPQAAAQLHLEPARVQQALDSLSERGRVVAGRFRHDATDPEWCDVGVLRRLRARSLAAMRRQIAPVEPDVLARFLPDWHGITRPRRGLDGLLDTIEQLQGTPLPASALEEEILPARVSGYRRSDLDELCLAGEILWRGCDSTGPRDGRIAVYLTDRYPLLAAPVEPLPGAAEAAIRSLLSERGALLFSQIRQAIGGFPNDLLETLWDLVWNGEITNDTLGPLRSRLQTTRPGNRRTTARSRRAYRSRRDVRLAGSEGRWSLLPTLQGDHEPPLPSVTQRQTAIAEQLLDRYGILTREMLSREQIAGGFSGIYPVLRAMEEAGRVRRGYFVAGLGAAQFAAAGADDRLRDAGQARGGDGLLVLAATDPANAWGNIVPWPPTGDGTRPNRVAGARVILHQGRPLGYLNRTARALTTFQDATADAHASAADLKLLAEALAGLARPGTSLMIEHIDGAPPGRSPLAEVLEECGFTPTGSGHLHTGQPPLDTSGLSPAAAPDVDEP